MSRQYFIFREGNELADFLVNLAFENTGRLEFNSFTDLPSLARKIVNIDKQQISTLGIKTERIIDSRERGKGEATYIVRLHSTEARNNG